MSLLAQSAHLPYSFEYLMATWFIFCLLCLSPRSWRVPKVICKVFYVQNLPRSLWEKYVLKQIDAKSVSHSMASGRVVVFNFRLHVYFVKRAGTQNNKFYQLVSPPFTPVNPHRRASGVSQRAACWGSPAEKDTLQTLITSADPHRRSSVTPVSLSKSLFLNNGIGNVRRSPISS